MVSFIVINVTNSMACRVFGLLRELNINEEAVPLFQLSTIHFGESPLEGCDSTGATK